MPRQKQKFYKVPKEDRGGHARYALQVVRIRGPKKGEPYVRTFKDQSSMNAYIARNTGQGKAEMAVGSFTDWTTRQKKVAKRSFMKDLMGWLKEGLGFGKMTTEEKQYLRAFKEEVGRNPRPWEDPYLMERSGEFVDKVFTGLTIAAGPGLALSGVKAAVAGTRLATQGAARAATKTAFKKAIKGAAWELVKKDTVKGTLKRAAKYSAKGVGKGLEASHKIDQVHTYASMVQNAANNVFGK